MTSKTFTIIKPNAVAKGAIGKITDMITSAGFRIIGMKMTDLSRNDAERFYYVHKGRPFFRNLVLFMTAGPIVAIALEKEGENAVADFRKLIGSTNPDMADEGTIRKLFADSKTRNAIHASDSPENAAWETAFFFRPEEIIETLYDLPISAEAIDAD